MKKKAEQQKAASKCEGGKDGADQRSRRMALCGLLIAIVLVVATALHLLSAWVAPEIVGILWLGFAIWSKPHQ